MSDMPVCPDCGKPMGSHCVIWPHDGEMVVQCPLPTRCISLTGRAPALGIDDGRQCRRRAVWFHHRMGWCTQHAPSYLKEAIRA